jgi:hypothetical protein
MSFKTIRTLFTAAAAFLLMISCGSEESTPEPPAPVTQPAPDAPAKADTSRRENTIVEKMDPDGKAMHLTATDPTGKKFQASIGDDVDIPSEFPGDVPVFPGATPMASMSSPDEGIIVTFKSSEEQQDIFDFYNSSLANDGWDITVGEPTSNQLSLEAHKDNRKVSVIVGGRTGDSRVSVIVTPSN